MHIANPIYDVVFKFMMEDEKVAKSFLSAIIEEEVLELNFSAQEHTFRRPFNNPTSEETVEKLFLTVCRFDFAAQIADSDGGVKTVMIELQKAKLSTDIMRFRRYLGVHYQNPNNTYGSEEHKKACPIYGIFLLGYDIGIHGCPIIQVDHSIKDGTTKQKLEITNEFIQSLHHRSWIIQIDQLKQRHRNDAEKLLSIFDQDNRTSNHHILNVDEDEFPEIYRPIIRRLRMASESEDIQVEMEMEDDFMKDLQDKERLIAKQNKVLEEKVKTIEDQDKALKEKDKALEEKDKALEEKDKALEEKNKFIEELKKQLATPQKKN
ncbi:MAG: hypothetical protein LBC20_02390 [Planctomycetaceae bacterium]|jgi:hypothetical protein|nr:hypothetical protein [Planctomycetaceae bacterium]